MRQFVGERDAGGKCRVYVEDDSDVGAPRRRLRHRTGPGSKSPTGFEWGYGGSGPSELARALVAEVTGDDDPQPRLYQRFKARVVQRLDHQQWTLDAATVEACISEICAELRQEDEQHA